MKFKLIFILMFLLSFNFIYGDNWVTDFQNSEKVSQQLEENKEVYDWESYVLTDTELGIQQASTESSNIVRLDDLLHAQKVQEQYNIQETVLDLIVGVFILILDILIIIYYIIELWFFMMLFGKWIPSLFKKMANSTGNFFIKMRSRQ